MEKHEFYSQYANMPLAERKLDQGGMSAYDIYREMLNLDLEMNPFITRQEELLRLADKIFKIYE